MNDANASSPETTALLRRFARRLSADAGYMAGAMAQYQKSEQIDDEALAQLLGTSVEMLTRLAMCKRPDPNSARFADEVRQIAIFTGSDANVLARLLRQMHALATFAEIPRPAAHADTARASRFDSGILAAARDQANTPESQSDSAPPDELLDTSSDNEART